MSAFKEAELASLHLGPDRRLARIATVGNDLMPHVVPTGWTHNVEADTIDIAGHDLPRTKKFRDVARTGRAAVVIDDLASSARGARGRWRCVAERRRSSTPPR